jgi:ABC-type Zn uptake system ZnuABC Zn-binding protein ZnuA
LISALVGCHKDQATANVVATTLPVYEFTTYICHGSDIHVERLITENVSCLHDYTLKVSQMRAIETAELIITSGAGLEDFLHDALTSADNIIDTSEGIQLITNCEETAHTASGHSHHHEHDPHIWLSPENAKIMASNITDALSEKYPEHRNLFNKNLSELMCELDALSIYANEQLSALSNKKIITFHDGFSYMAESFGLEIVHAVEEESGSEASAAELITLTRIISDNKVKALFTEVNGSTSAASIIANETGISIYTLDMAMSQRSYFEAMYHNIDTLKEALQ